MEGRIRERYVASVSANPFEKSMRYREIAVEELRRLGLAAIAKA
jgi:hypothetical protein